ncbi:D-alanyl-D-alanine carboxypeptidase, partial [Klebsiella pneumoniae]
AFWSLGALDQPDEAGGAAVRIDQTGNQRDVILEGHGDARLSSAPACTVDCLATLADAVAAKTRVVHDVVGDDSLYPDQRWSPGMSWNNIPTKSGTA